MKDRVDNLDTALDYEWKGLEDPFYQERRNILALGTRMYLNGPIDKFKLGGYAFCITCGSAISEGGGDVNVIGFVVTNVVRYMMNAPVLE
jgi:hypothetical protein